VRAAGVMLGVALVAHAARAAPPPAGSEDAVLMAPYSAEIRRMQANGAICCSESDGRPVEVKIVEIDGEPHYEVRFLHPETLVDGIGLLYGKAPGDGWNKVPDTAVIRQSGTIPFPMAWWNAGLGEVRCFWPGSAY
jgi:hypothetical protein